MVLIDKFWVVTERKRFLKSVAGLSPFHLSLPLTKDYFFAIKALINIIHCTDLLCAVDLHEAFVCEILRCSLAVF